MTKETAGGHGRYDRSRYNRDVSAAYKYLANPRVIPAEPATSLGMVFFHTAHTEAQTGLTLVHEQGAMMMRLLASGDPRSSLRILSTTALPDNTATHLARKAADIHGYRNIPDIELERMVDMNKFIFGATMDHIFDSIARLSPEGAVQLGGARIPYDEGIALLENAARPREVTLPLVEQFLRDPQNAANVTQLFSATSQALLSPAAKEARAAFLQELEDAAIREREGVTTEDQRKAEQLEARRAYWREASPILTAAVNTIEDTTLTQQQKEDFAHNTSTMYILLSPPSEEAHTSGQ